MHVKSRTAVGIVLICLAIGSSLVLGTIGWFMIGFGILTDCTNNYSCTETGCPPCETTGRWINVGAIAQWVLAGTGVLVLRAGLRAGRESFIVTAGITLLAISVLTAVATTRLAEGSYCQPGSPGYARSNCPVDG